MPLPVVAGTLQRDIDPAAYNALADDTQLTFANSGLSQVGTQPLARLARDVWGAGKHAVRVNSAQHSGFRINNPVTNDFTIYGLFRWPTSRGQLAPNWDANGSLFNTRTSGGNNSYGATLRSDGKVTAGVGSMGGGLGGDQTVFGAAVIGGDTHIVTIRRVKASTLFRLYVDGVLQGSFNYNSNSLSVGGVMDFGVGGTPWDTGFYLGRWLAYDAAHSDADLALVWNYLTATYPPNPTLRAPKLVDYAVEGTPPRDMYSTKIVEYLIGGASPDKLSTDKVVLYQATSYSAALRAAKLVLYEVTRTGPGPGDYPGAISECHYAERPDNDIVLCATRPNSAAERCQTRPEGTAIYPGQPYRRH